jgi:hypothetical protein
MLWNKTWEQIMQMLKPYVSSSKRRSILDHEVAVISSREHKDVFYWRQWYFVNTP